MSTGLELQVIMPVVNAPFRVYYAYNPLRIDETVCSPNPITRGMFPPGAAGDFTYAQAVSTFPTELSVARAQEDLPLHRRHHVLGARFHLSGLAGRCRRIDPGLTLRSGLPYNPRYPHRRIFRPGSVRGCILSSCAVLRQSRQNAAGSRSPLEHLRNSRSSSRSYTNSMKRTFVSHRRACCGSHHFGAGPIRFANPWWRRTRCLHSTAATLPLPAASKSAPSTCRKQLPAAMKARVISKR